MKRTISLLGIVSLMLLSLGCQSRQIVEAKTSTPNAITMELAGTGDQLVANKTIDLRREFVMQDGTPLDVWVINARGPSPGQKPEKVLGTVVVLHGLGESKANYLGVGANLAKMGYDVVLIDLRCHGRSGGKYITCGAKEKKDVQTIVDILQKDGKIGDGPLYVLGVNFGGAVAIQYAAIEPKVNGVVAIAAWKDTAAKARRDMGPLMSEEDLKKNLNEAGKLADFDPWKTSALLDIPKIKCPVYLIHGLVDFSGVSVEESQALFAAANDPKRLHIMTPGPEQVALMMVWEQWLADQVDLVAKGKLKSRPAGPEAEAASPQATPPTIQPTTAPAN